jgi:ketosteroid isomerase-like protein
MTTSIAADQIRDAEARRYAAMIANDRKALDALLADDLVYTHSTAATETKAEFIDRLSSGLRYRKITQREQTVRVFGDVGIVNGLNQMDVERKGEPISFGIRFLAVYVRDGADWRMRAWQSTRLP